MASQAIGSLYVAMGLDSAAFTQGVKRIQGASGKLQDGLERVGNAATAMGKRLSVVSAGMAAVGASAIALVKGTADAAKEISIQSKLANASTREFQRWAAGSRSVGIQQDKLSDILKDVNDRVGDFMETGGGEMADFFEKVAPKVGVTAEQFKNLSGPQALQLYVDTLQKAGLNQQQMTFYMEAMADDATALIPLLMNGGAAMEGFGNAAEKSGAVLSESAIKGSLEFQSKLRTLQEAVQGARNRLAEVLIPIVNRFMDVLVAEVVPAMDKAITKIGELIQWFGNLPESVQSAAAIIATVFGAGGPVLLAIGAVSLAIRTLISAAGPIGMFIVAAGLLAGAWQAWGTEIKAAVGGAIDYLSAKFQAVVDFLQRIIDKAVAVKNAITDALSMGKGDQSTTYMTPDQMRKIGIDTGAGLVGGIGQGLADGEAEIRGYLDKHVTEATKSEFDTHSPSRVFHQIGTWLMQGLSGGIGSSASLATGAVNDVGETVNEAAAKSSSGFDTFASNAQNAFQSVISGTQTVKDALKGLAASWLSSKASSLMSSGFSGLMGALKIPGFANGVSSFRGGIAQINERGGEIVDLPSGTRVIPHDISKRMAAGQGGGMAEIVLHAPAGFTASQLGQIEGVSLRVVQSAAPEIVGQSVSSTRRAMNKSKSGFGI